MKSTDGLSLSPHAAAAERRGFDTSLGRKLCAGARQVCCRIFMS